tara:strand:- start:1036 stop:1209 length:174 start_codon:yes stop_codon:yes gene_type:complete
MNCDCTNKEECQKDCEAVETAETAEHIGFDCWIEDMEEQEKSNCNVDNKEDCENCGS